VNEVSWTDVLSSISAAVAAAVVLAGLVIAYRQLQEMARSRNAQLLTDYMTRWDAAALVEARMLAASFGSRDALCNNVERLYKDNDPKYYVLMRVPTFFENVATLEESGGMSTELIRKHFGRLVFDAYYFWEPSITFLRNRGATGLDGFKRLADEFGRGAPR
jgi:hypothetical protein